MELQPEFKPVKNSQTTLTELMIPAYANFGGKIHGGIILSLMDKVAYVCAAKHAGNYCVTASIDGVDFKEPVEVGEMVSLMATVNYTGNTSVVVGIRVVSENVTTNVIKHTNTSYFTMVAKDVNNQPAIVPGLILETPDQLRRFAEAKRRRQLKENYKKEINNVKKTLGTDNLIDMLKGERCVIADDLIK